MTASAFIALLPFDILTRNEAHVSPHQIRWDDRDVVLYWPFWHEPTPARRIPPVRSIAIPSRSSEAFYRIPPFDIHIEIPPPPDSSFANALRIDVLQAVDDRFVTAIATNLLSHIRVRTNQWWIGHAHLEGEGLVRAAYNIDADGFLVGQDCRAGAIVEPRIGIERPLEEAAFSSACASLAGGGTVPAHWDMFYDALYFSIHQEDWRRALLDACIACDLAVIYESIRAGRDLGKPEPVVRHSLSDRNLLVNLEKGLPAIFGQNANYSETQRSDFKLIRRLWKARGSIAHGQAPATGDFGRGFMPSREEAADLILAAMRLLAWLAGLPHSSPLGAV